LCCYGNELLNLCTLSNFIYIIQLNRHTISWCVWSLIVFISICASVYQEIYIGCYWVFYYFCNHTWYFTYSTSLLNSMPYCFDTLNQYACFKYHPLHILKFLFKFHPYSKWYFHYIHSQIYHWLILFLLAPNKSCIG